VPWSAKKEGKRYLVQYEPYRNYTKKAIFGRARRRRKGNSQEKYSKNHCEAKWTRGAVKPPDWKIKRIECRTYLLYWHFLHFWQSTLLTICIASEVMKASKGEAIGDEGDDFCLSFRWHDWYDRSNQMVWSPVMDTSA